MARVYLSPPHLSGREQELVADAIASNWIAPLGPHVDAFERELAARAEVPEVLALASGTAALHLALIVAGIGPGDRVAVSSLTFSASANPIVYVGAEPVFIDCDHTWTMDPELLAEELEDSARRGRPIRAVITVDLYGQSCDYARIAPLCMQHGAVLIQDAAEALGSTYRGRPVGGQGDLAAFSFNGNKIITTSGGGMLVTPHATIAQRVRHLATQAREPAPHYEHARIGYNYRLSNVLAGIGRAQLRLLEDRVAARRAIFTRYHDALGTLPGLTLMPEETFAHAGSRANRWLTVITIDPQSFGVSAEDVRFALERENIESRPVWKPMHLQPVFAGCPAFVNGTSEKLFENGLCLPSGSNIDEEGRQRIAEVLKQELIRQ